MWRVCVSCFAGAERPFVIVGYGWSCEAKETIARRSDGGERDLPVGCVPLSGHARQQYRTQGDVGIGINPKLFARIKNADVVFDHRCAARRITTSGYTLFKGADARRDDDHGARRVTPMVGPRVSGGRHDYAGVAGFAAAMAGLKLDEIRRRRAKPLARSLKPISPPAWPAAALKNRATPAKLNLWEVVQTMKRLAPKDSIVALATLPPGRIASGRMPASSIAINRSSHPPAAPWVTACPLR